MGEMRYMRGTVCLLAVLTAGCIDNAPSPEQANATQANLNYLKRTSTSVFFEPLVEPSPENHAKVQLGKHLFFDPRLSRDNTVSCATCHDVANGGDDGRATAVGIDGAVGPFNTPTVLNASLNFAQFWDGRAADLVSQVAGPVHNPIEMGSHWDEVVSKLEADAAFMAAFDDVYPGEALSGEVISDAIAEYEAQLITANSPFDAYLLGDENALSERAREGLKTFTGLGCVACHQGRSLGSNMYQRFGVAGNYFEDRGNLTEADFGRYNVTGQEEDKFYFKVPSLRNVADTAPYFHDGSVSDLSEAVRIMARYQLGRPITDRQVQAIVAFLESLSGTVDETML